MLLPSFHKPNSYSSHGLPNGWILMVVLWTGRWVPMWSSNHWDPTLPSMFPISQVIGTASIWVSTLCSYGSYGLCLPPPRRTPPSLQLEAGTCHPWDFIDAVSLTAWASKPCSSGDFPHHMSSLFIAAIVSTKHWVKAWPQAGILLGNHTYWLNLGGQPSLLLSMPFAF